MSKQDLGKLESVYGIAPVFMQRAAIVAIVSFIFFLAMLVMFSLRGSLLYFLLATGFLVVEIFTLIGWFFQRGTELKIYQNGFNYKKYSSLWTEIKSVSSKSVNKYEIVKESGEKIILTELIQDIETAIKKIEAKVNKNQ